ncbi:fatty acid metabolism regulator protein [Duganella phyllosphaerae]|uniref:Fatty acid metabolism regulator protein n=2 Tax=Duganella phyllosphaerae TaxID=762836 RepID=A0A1E7WZD5_9BURK|nr:fatty acid metabolism regulator protein [Duganella phyllosphaerae]
MPRRISDNLVLQIKQYLALHAMPTGARLTERALAERFKVSRSPVREALRRLADEGILTEQDDGGHAVSEHGAALHQTPEALLTAPDPLEQAYFAIAEDRLEGKLPERVTENEFARRYDLTRAQLAAVLRRMVQEGWIERLPGHGWQFRPVLTSADTYDQGYRFRILIESAGILEPTFRANLAALRRCELQQRELLDHINDASAADIFNANTQLHETIAECSGNVFIIDALTRLNSLRRLMEYRKSFDRAAAARRCREHLVLIDLLLDGQQEAAADFISRHLRDAANEKSARSEAPG